MKKLLLALLFTPPTLLFAQSRYVNPMLGTAGTGHTFPAATVPFGMVQVGPDTRIDGSWEGCSGYHYSDSVIYGFSHTHLSGTGCSDYGDIMLMPYVGTLPAKPAPQFYATSFLHANEKAEPGYYSVLLDRGNIRCEMSATTHAAIHRYTLSASQKADTLRIVMDLSHRDRLLEYSIRQKGDWAVCGYRSSKAWARQQKVYYYWEADKAIVSVTSVTPYCRVFSFVLKPGETLGIRVGISAVDEKGAENNVRSEIADFNITTVREKALKQWDAELSKINITGGSEADRTNFYTALYHTMIQPNTFSDVDGRYRGHDGKIHRTDHTYYTVFSLWDTFRALHPLHTLINRERTAHFVETFLLQYKQGGRLPMWELWCNETDCMIGYHAVAVLAEARTKGIPMDVNLALEAALANANYPERSVPLYAQKGYLEVGDEPESVAKTLEYAFDDWCVARLAQAAGKPQTAAVFEKRATAWMNLLDPETDLMRPRVNGGWLTPFDPREVNNHYTEANAWQYSFFVPHDVYGLISATGGPERFEGLLDALFTAPVQTTGREQVDITGLIGQYAHGNEPSHHMAYLYNYVGKPEKMARYVHQILTELYHPVPDGLPGNEDCGQMSAWYVFSAMGFYPVTPGSNHYAIGFPLFKESVIKFENGKTFTIRAEGNVKGNYFPQAIELNGKPIHRLWFTHDEIAQGGTLFLKYGPVANPAMETWEKFPLGNTSPFVAAPAIKAPEGPFKNGLEVTLEPFSPTDTIFYITTGNNPSTGQKYTGPFTVTGSGTVKAVAKNAHGDVSAVAMARLQPFPHPEWKVSLESAYNAQYAAGGPEALIDGVRGDKDWRKGNWQGYQGADFVAELDLAKPTGIRHIHIGFLQDERSWILLPRQVEVELLDEKRQVVKRLQQTLPIKDRVEESFLWPVSFNGRWPGVRYVHIKAVNYGQLPAWHPGAGSPAFIFVDEISVE